jgi:peptidoglycan/xylan/chitin deacetylase (PgdA/CDA1 family)
MISGKTNLVLNFHTVSSSKQFKKILTVIGGFYKFISAEEIEDFFHSGKPLKSSCHITFDDGENSFYEKAFPVLQELKIPATLFVSPYIIENKLNYWFQELDYIKKHISETEIKKIIKEKIKAEDETIAGADIKALIKTLNYKTIHELINELKSKNNLPVPLNFNIDREKLLKLRESGLVTIGAHTVHHPILSNESDGDAEREISDSVKMLSEILGKKIKYFAYPNGIEGMDFTKREQDILSANRIKLAFTTNSGFFKSSNNPLSVPRGSFECDNESKTRIITKLLLIHYWDKIRIRKEVKDRLMLRSLKFN